MNGRIAVLCPTRNRPDAAIDTYLSMVRTSTDADMILCVGSDQKEMYGHIVEEDRLKMFYGSPENVVGRINAAISFYGEYGYYGTIVDDAKFIAPGWDVWVKDKIQEFPKRLGVASAHHNNGPWVNFPYVSKEWIGVVGWYACPHVLRFCWDTVAEILGDASSIAYATEDEFHINHEWLRGEDYVGASERDAKNFLVWCVTQRRDLMAKLKEAMR